MSIIEFQRELKARAEQFFNEHSVFFLVDIPKDVMWQEYQEAFPPGTNEIFRERREHDCNCCRQFINGLGRVVGVREDNTLESIWDLDSSDDTFGPVAKRLSEVVRDGRVSHVFHTRDGRIGIEKSYEETEDGSALEWRHLYAPIPDKVRNALQDITLNETPQNKGVLKRSLEELTTEAVDTVLDLVSQNSLYKGEEWKAALTRFRSLQDVYSEIQDEQQKDNFCWIKSLSESMAIVKIRNTSMGTLLIDLSAGMDVEEAVRRFEKVVAPSNYKRPKAIFTKRMVEEAQKTIEGLGLTASLPRRFATLEDITVNNILFSDRDSLKVLDQDLFEQLKSESSSVKPKKFDKVEEIPIQKFLADVVPRISKLEVLVENRHESNLVSLIAPQNRDSKTLFKWANGFSWAYSGNITDSMKQRVKSFGGQVENVVSRFSIQWNEDKTNNDLDAHCEEPGGNLIYYGNKGQKHRSSGMLDVDIIRPNYDVPSSDKIAVENIVHTSRSKMPEGVYTYLVHCYSFRMQNNGFSAEIELDGHLYEFTYPTSIRQGEKIKVAKVRFDRQSGFTLLESLPEKNRNKDLWGVTTNNFVPVSVLMFSPNYWDEQQGIGHKHVFFMLKNCVNDTQPNGFFNEFLREDLNKHRKVFEAIGGKMKVSDSERQLSGLGFSTTKRNSIVCKVEGSIQRTLKVTF